jgi:hypothetical protein
LAKQNPLVAGDKLGSRIWMIRSSCICLLYEFKKVILVVCIIIFSLILKIKVSTWYHLRSN